MSNNVPPDEDRTVVDGAGSAASAASDVPDRIGAYRLIRQLGRGGMGEVYLAEQLEPVQRKVALKLIGARAQGGSVGAMFEVERQMLARMHHPAIAQVFDAGTADDGRPWFAMEWVRGEPIVDHVERHALGIEQRLDLFVRVCGGIQHAHQQGVIHRDIKPGNVLVDRVDGVSMPKIIDFGVATGVVEHAGRARSDTTDRAGTRGYMSPELLAGPAAEVDTRTDVYSLGVLLFELLTDGRPPPADDTVAIDSIRRMLLGSTGRDTPLDGDALKSAHDARHLPRELRWILARALAPDREERYDSAASLARDLRRYLNNEVVEAVPNTRAYRGRKFLARHALAVSAASVVTLALVAGLVVAVYGLLEARAQADRAEQIAAFATRMLSSIDPEVAEGAPTPVLDRVLADAAERVDKELAGQPRIRAEIELTIGEVYASLGQYERAREHLQNVLELIDRRQAVEIYLDAGAELSLIDIQESKLADAERRVDQLLHTAEQHLPERRVQWLDLLSIRGSVRFEQARHDEAFAIYQRILDEIGPEPPDALRWTYVSVMRQMGQSYSEIYELEQAGQWFQAALEATSEWDDPTARSIRTKLFNDRGVVLLRQQRYAEAESVLREGLRESVRLYGEDHPGLIVQYGNMAGALRQQGGDDKLEASLPYYERARGMAVERYGPDHPQSVAFTYNLGNAYRDSGQVDQALAMHREALERRSVMPESHMFQGLVHFGLGQSELAAGHFEAARDHLQTAVDRLGELVGEDFVRRIEAMDFLAQAYDELGRPDRAAALREEAEALRAAGSE
ncbi:protein kinase domain-containing protein [Wenzhouxiangella sp. EGI_FJ10409]|uniref:protein kinase domain-containing protein n=1 Tax=Wenzhouxiangella sp. EGI_FJ10409 TaxID=3243767 RepID=UPI0035DD0886